MIILGVPPQQAQQCFLYNEKCNVNKNTVYTFFSHIFINFFSPRHHFWWVYTNHLPNDDNRNELEFELEKGKKQLKKNNTFSIKLSTHF